MSRKGLQCQMDIIPEGYVCTQGTGFACATSCYSGSATPGAVGYRVKLDCETLQDERVTPRFSDCFHSSLDGVITPNLLPSGTGRVIKTTPHWTYVLVSYSTGLHLVVCNGIYSFCRIVGESLRLQAPFKPSAVWNVKTSYGNGKGWSIAGVGSAEAYETRVDGTSPIDMSITYIGDGKFRRTGSKLTPLIVPGLELGTITSQHVLVPSREECMEKLYAISATKRHLVASTIFEDADMLRQQTVNCIMSADYLDINSIAFLRDMKEFRALLSSVTSLLRGEVNIKNLSQLLLIKKYAIDTTYRDVKEILEVAPRVASDIRNYINTTRPRRYHDRGEVTISKYINELSGIFDTTLLANMQCTTSLYLTPEGVREGLGLFLEALDSFDLLPTVENLWDLVPYSFVVDWFIGLGDNFTALAAERKSSKYILNALIYSEKIEVDLPLVGPDFLGTIHFSNYSRRVSTSWPGYTFGLNFDLPFTHFLEGAALIVQRT